MSEANEAPAGKKVSKVAENRAAKLADLKNKAFEILRLEGIEALTMHRLAKASKQRVGGLYRYFASRDELLAALQIDILVGLRDELNRAESRGRSRAPHPEALALSAVWARVEGFLDVARKDPREIQFIGVAVNNPAKLVAEPMYEDVMRVTMQLLEESAQSLRDASLCGDRDLVALDLTPIQRAVLLWTGLQSALQLAKIGRIAPDVFAPFVLARASAKALLVSWGADVAILETVIQNVSKEHASTPNTSQNLNAGAYS